MKTKRIAVVAVLAAVTACMDDGGLPTSPAAVQFSSHVSTVACSTDALIAAIETANELPAATLNLTHPCVYRLSLPHTISPVTGITGLPVITSTLTINGNGATIERAEGSDFRLLYVLNAEGPDQAEEGRGNLTLTNVTLRGGSYSNSGGALFVHGGTHTLTDVTIEDSHSGDDGGGVHNFQGTLLVTRGVIRNNSASDHGGGLSNNLGHVKIVGTLIENNAASDQGGGVANAFGTLVMEDATVRGNDAGDSGGMYNEGGTVSLLRTQLVHNSASDHGGGLQNLLAGEVTITSSVISGNRAEDSGGGLSNHGRKLFVNQSTITGNHAADAGAGIANGDGAELIVISSSVSGNDADEDGGGLYNSGGTVTISNSTVSGNIAKYGGGLGTEGGDDILDGVLVSPGSVTLINTTVSGNTAREGGGGIWADKKSQLTVQFSTITNNTAQTKDGGGVLIYSDEYAQTKFMGTIVSANSPHDVAAVERKSSTCCSEGHNLIGRAGGPYISLSTDFGATGDLRGVTSPGLGSLADNGGPTLTHALLAGSPALPGAGGNVCPAVDQRGILRNFPCAIGAFQAAAAAPALQTITFPPPPSPQPFGGSFTVAPFASSGLPVTLAASGVCSVVGYVVTMTAASGTCALTASQSGSPDFQPAANVQRFVAATLAAQAITFTSTPPSPAQVGGTYVPTATGGGSGNPVTFGATGSCTFSSGVVSLNTGGLCTVTANQAGNSQYGAAPQATQTFTVQALSQVNFKAQSNGQNGSALTLRINRPSSVTAGDFLLAQITFEKGSDVQITASGWALVRRTNNGSDIGQAIFRKVAGSSEPVAYTFTFSQSVKAVGGILAYTGVKTSDPIVASSGRTGVSSALTANSITAENNGMLVALYGFKKKEVTLTVPTGMTGRYNFENPNDLTIGADEERRSLWPNPTGNRISSAVQPGATSPVTEKFVAQLVMLRAN